MVIGSFGSLDQYKLVKPTNKWVSQIELYFENIEVTSLLLYNGSFGVVSCIGQQNQQQKKYQDEYESNTKVYQIIDSTKWYLLWVWYRW